jgi:hypothetical protein
MLITALHAAATAALINLFVLYTPLQAETWEDANLFNCHMAWHLCLYFLDQGNYQAALRVYDLNMCKVQPCKTSAAHAASMLVNARSCCEIAL